jgi:hypothetical protein
MSADGVETAARTTSSSSRSSIRKQNPQQQLQQIEKSVTHLLVATKQLLETLTQWSRGTATEGEVSDVYVRLGYEFNIACRAFNAIGVDTQDLGPVPDLLRSILEDTLSQEASQASLDKYLPRIRDIIISLLQGLKRKQARIRSRSTREFDQPPPAPPHDDIQFALNRGSSSGRPSGRNGSITDLPPRTSSIVEGRSSPLPTPDSSQHSRYDSQGMLKTSDPALSTMAAQSTLSAPPYPSEDSMPSAPSPNLESSPAGAAQPAKDAFLALQRGGDLERRASRRFSTYQINKQLGGSNIILPPTQNGPVPNRGREVRESINAVRQRGSQLYNRGKAERRLMGEESPNRQQVERITEEKIDVRSLKDEQRGYVEADSIEVPNLSATITSPVDAPASTPEPKAKSTPIRTPAVKGRTVSPSEMQQFVPEESPQPGKPLTLFLQFKSKVKKFVLDDGSNDLSIARLQLAFIDKFAWNTHGNGMDLPEIYLQDSVSGVRYELEDLNDIKNNSVLVLNYEPMEEVKRHIDDNISGLRRVVEGIKSAVDNQGSVIQRIGDRQQETQKELATIALTPSPVRGVPQGSPSALNTGSLATGKFSGDLAEIQSLRRNLAILRQSYSSMVSDVEASMADIRTKAKYVKSAAVTAALPSLSGESGRSYVKNTLYGTLSKDQSSIVERVDDVQDSIEDLRKDVVTRGVRPLPRQLEQVAKDLQNATADLKKLESFVSKETPMWNKIWKQELQDVCDDREVLSEAEALISDMKLDLEESQKTFKLVEEACRQQNATAAVPGAPNGAPMGTSLITSAPVLRSSSGNARVAALNLGGAVGAGEVTKARDGILVEVKGLQVDHESRLEAIERAERARQKELESRKEGEQFKRELGDFVEEGKLKKSGGVDEVERVRKIRDAQTRRENWERMQQRAAEQAEREAREAAQRAQEQQS